MRRTGGVTGHVSGSAGASPSRDCRRTKREPLTTAGPAAPLPACRQFHSHAIPVFKRCAKLELLAWVRRYQQPDAFFISRRLLSVAHGAEGELLFRAGHDRCRPSAWS